jgi:hypothetical protein
MDEYRIVDYIYCKTATEKVIVHNNATKTRGVPFYWAIGGSLSSRNWSKKCMPATK